MRIYFLLTVFSVFLFLPGINNLPVVERDEAHFVQASRQMLQTGNYFQVRFQHITRFQKPPGINWLQAGAVYLFSDMETHDIWPYRLPSVICAWLAVLATYFFSRRALGNRVAFLASSLLASALLMVFVVHMAVIDGALLLSVVLMQGALWVIFNAGMQKQKVAIGWPLLFWLALTVGCVLKGVTPLVGCLSILTLWVMVKQKDWLKGLKFWQGGVLFLGLTLAWLLPMNVAEHSNYLGEMLHRDLLPKLQGGHESHGKPPLFHLVILPLTFWPGSLFLSQMRRYSWKERHNLDIQFLLAWLIPTWIFFELMPTKLPHYVLPTFPALAILVALAINSRTKRSRIEHGLQVLWGVLSLGLAVAVTLLPYLLIGKLTLGSLITGLMIFGTSLLGVYWAWSGRYLHAATVLCVGAAIVFPLLFAIILPEMKPLWIEKTVAEQLEHAAISEEKPLFATGFVEPGLVFYFNTYQVKFEENEKAAISQCLQKKSYLLIPDSSTELQNERPRLQFIQQIRGYNYSKGRWVNLLLMSCRVH